MKEIINSLSEQFKAFEIDANKAANGNKSAGIRARKATIAMEKAFKEFRKESLK